MKTKTIPFDIELAKDIQSGKVEGRIVCRTGRPARILCTDFKDEDEIFTVAVAIEENCLQEKLVRVRTDGTYSAYKSDMDLFIELPEEAPKQQCGDMCGDDRFEIIEKAKKAILEETNIDTRPEEIAVLDSFLFRCWQMGWLKEYEKIVHKETPKHEFKPFDKVLVRDNSEDKWVPDIFRYYDDNYPKDYPYRCCANDYKQCIPYTGNEHLVGTTDNPKED